MRRITIPRDIYIGTGALEGLKDLEAKSALIVTEKLMTKLGFTGKVESILKQIGVEVTVFDEVEADPSRQIIDRGAMMAAECKPDLIVGLGGGSSIDAAKGIWLFYEHPGISWDEAHATVATRRLREKAKFVAIASTSGTGSEATRAAVITNRDVTPAVKRGLGSTHMAPDVAIVDPELPATMPPSVTANTGFDVLVHAIETYVTRGANDFADALAIKATQMVFDWLPKAVADGSDLVAREKMHNASLLAGIAFSNAGLGSVHATAHQLGGAFSIPHGRGNAFMLCPVIKFNSSVAAVRYADIARAIGIQAATVEKATERLVEAINLLKVQAGIPLSIKADGLDEKTFMDNLEQVTENGFNDGSNRGNPRQPTKEDIRNLFMSAWNGE